MIINVIIDLTKHTSTSTLAVYHEGKQLEIAVEFTHGSESSKLSRMGV